MFWLILAAILAAVIWYALKGRAWLKSQSWTGGFFAWIEPIETVLFKKSETILMGRLLWVGGLFVTAYDTVASLVSSLDITPLTTRIFDWLQIPPDMRGLTVSAFVAVIGLMINRLRAKVTKPLELVAVPDAQITPAAAVAMAKAETATDQAVAAVAEAKS
jgi:hypothetical protein